MTPVRSVVVGLAATAALYVLQGVPYALYLVAVGASPPRSYDDLIAMFPFWFSVEWTTAVVVFGFTLVYFVNRGRPQRRMAAVGSALLCPAVYLAVALVFGALVVHRGFPFPELLNHYTAFAGAFGALWIALGVSVIVHWRTGLFGSSSATRTD